MTKMPELQQLAEMCGLLTEFKDVFGRRQHASEDSILAVLHGLGIEIGAMDDVSRVLAEQQLQRLERPVEPVLVSWDGNGLSFDLTLPADVKSAEVNCIIDWEDRHDRSGPDKPIEHRVSLSGLARKKSPCGRFVTRRIEMLVQLPHGYHRLTVDAGGTTGKACIISAPLRAFAPDAARREWGCFLPLYALKSERNGGAGDFTDFKHLAKWMAGMGGAVLGTLPLLAAYLDYPFEPSPYSPCSRLAWNEFYVDVSSIPEMATSPRASERIQSSNVVESARQHRRKEQVDYRQIMSLKRGVIEILADEFFEQPPSKRYGEYEQFLGRHPHIENYAEYRATYEKRRESWPNWPERLRNGDLQPSDYDEANKRYHLYAQWIATSQLESLADTAGGGLYLDLPLGVRSDGYDVWRWNDCYATDVSAGSPPERMWTNGQNWGFPPLHPEKIREDGYRHVRVYLNHHLRLARLLRIDHVMQLHRLYWIPDGMHASKGVYVRYRPEEFYAILCLESERCKSVIIGENLGTVPPAVDEAMLRHNIRQMFVVQYATAAVPKIEVEAAVHGESSTKSSVKKKGARSKETGKTEVAEIEMLPRIPAGSLASLNTHDMPMFAAWWRGDDIELRQKIGLLTPEQVQVERAELEAKKKRLDHWLRDNGWLTAPPPADDVAILTAIYAYLAASDAGVVLVNLEDLWLETQPQNIPGTGHELPNWRRKASEPFETFADNPYVRQTLQNIDRLRKQQ